MKRIETKLYISIFLKDNIFLYVRLHFQAINKTKLNRFNIRNKNKMKNMQKVETPASYRGKLVEVIVKSWVEDYKFEVISNNLAEQLQKRLDFLFQSPSFD